VFPYCFESSIKLINALINFKILHKNFRNAADLLIDYLGKMTDFFSSAGGNSNNLVDEYLKLI
jgi:hypothetical protein